MKDRSSSLYAYLILVLFAFLTAFFAWQASNFKIDASAETLLTKDNQHYLVSLQAGQRYASNEFILVAFKPDEGSIFSARNLNLVQEVSAELLDLDRVESVRSLINVPLFTGLESLEREFDADELTWQAKRYPSREFERNLTNHPLYEGLLFNEAKTALAMQVNFKPNPRLQTLEDEIVDIQTQLLTRELSDEEEARLNELSEERALLEEQLNKERSQEIEKIRSITQGYEDKGNFYLGGNNLLAHQLISIIKSDLVLFGAVIAAIVSALLYLLFRAFRFVAVPMLCCSVSVVLTVGLLGWLGLKVTVISANVIALQIILTLAVIIHLIVQYQELTADKTYTDHFQLVWAMLKHKARPSLYAGLTTGIGFGSLLISGVQPVISFGWVMVLAILVTLLVTLVFFPAVMITCFSAPPRTKQLRIIDTSIHACARLVDKRPGVIGMICGFIFLAGVIGCFRLTAENSFLNYFSSDTDVYRELSFIDQEFGGSTPFDVLYSIPKSQQDPQLVLTAEAVQTVGDIQRKLEQKEGIGNITSLHDFAVIAATVTGKPVTEYELTVLYKSLDKQMREDLFGAYFSEPDQEVRISTRIMDSTPGLNRSELVESVHEDMAELGIEPDQYTLTNLFVLYEDILSQLVRSQFMTLAIVYAAMALVLLVVFKSLKVALISLVPNVITTAVILGVMGLAGIPMDLMTITIASVAMGISVDDTIHYVHRYLEELGHDSPDPVRSSHLSVGYAMVYTTLIIAVGFSALMFSDFVPSVLFGLLTAVAMLVALVTDMTLLPVLLRRFVRTRGHAPKAAPGSTEPAKA